MELFRTFEQHGKILQVAAYSEPETLTPSAVEVSAPGTGNFEIGPLQLSAASLVAGEALTLTAQLRGEKIAYLYTELFFRDPDLGAYYGPVLREAVQASENALVNGVPHPVWPAEINLRLQLTPQLRLLTDGEASAFAFFSPVASAQPGYQLEGLVTRAGEEVSRRARLTFDEAGELQGALVYTEKGRRSLPRALKFKPGDQFRPFVQILTGPSAENPAWQVARGLSTPLTWQGTAFQWVAEPLMPGEYLLGLVVVDLDGAQTRQTVSLTLEAGLPG